MTNMKNQDILVELRRISKLLVLLVTKDQIQKKRIDTLATVGFQPKEIAALLGTTSGTVRAALSGIRKSKKQRPGKRKKNSTPL